MFITLSKEKYEKMKRHLSDLGIPHKAEITQEGLYHVTLPELSKAQSKEVFAGYMNMVTPKEQEGMLPPWLKYLNLTQQTDDSSKEQTAKEGQKSENNAQYQL